MFFFFSFFCGVEVFGPKGGPKTFEHLIFSGETQIFKRVGPPKTPIFEFSKMPLSVKRCPPRGGGGGEGRGRGGRGGEWVRRRRGEEGERGGKGRVRERPGKNTCSGEKKGGMAGQPLGDLLDAQEMLGHHTRLKKKRAEEKEHRTGAHWRRVGHRRSE